MDSVTLSIILQAKNEGLDAIKDVTDKLMDLRQEVSHAVVALIAISGQLKDLIDYTALTKVMMGQLVGQMKDLTDAVGDTNSKLDRLILTTELAAAASMNLATATATAAATTNATGAAANGAAFSIFGMGTAMSVLVTIIAAAAIVFAPFLLMIAGGIVILAAFAAGVVAVTAALALAFGPLALVTAGVIMLADRMFTSGQILVDPLAKFEAKIGDIADAWGKRAVPMAAQIMDFFTGLLPAVQNAGNVVLTWFGQNLPTILQIGGVAVKDLEGAFKTLWTAFTTFFSGMKEHLPTFEAFFGQLVNFGVGAITGLLQNLLRLSDWFLQRLPALAPIVGGSFDGLGKFIQDFGKKAGDVVDWFIKNWPEIKKTAQETWDSIKAGWDLIAPILRDLLPRVINDLLILFQMLKDHSEQITFVLNVLGIVVALVAAAFLITVGVITIVIAILITIIATIESIIQWIENLIGSIGNWLDQTQFLQLAMELQQKTLDLLGTALQSLPALLEGNLGSLGKLAGAFDAAAGAAGRLWAAVTRANAPTGAWQGPTGPASPGTSDLPTAQHGGMVPGLVGAPQMIMAHGGEAVLSTDQLDMMISLLSQLVDNTTPRSPFVNAAYGRA